MTKKKSKYSIAYKFASIWLSLMLLMALIQPIITSSKAWICKTETGYIFPVLLKQQQDAISCQWTLNAPISFDPGEIRMQERLKPPLSCSSESSCKRHWLGTDRLGRDVAAAMTYGLKQALIIGIGSMILVVLFGFLIGGIAAWYGDKKLVWTPIGALLRMMSILVFSILGSYLLYLKMGYATNPDITLPLLSVTIGLTLLFWYIAIRYERFRSVKASSVSIPVDRLLNGIIEFFQSLPVMLLLIVLATIVGKLNVWSLMLIIFFIRWPFAARYIRAEILAIRERAFMERLDQLNLPLYKILFREILPNTYHIMIALFAFGVSGAIILEATLTFLGLGLPLEQVSWGSLILHGREQPDAWWLVIFPGFAILMAVWSLIIVGEEIQRKVGMKGRILKL